MTRRSLEERFADKVDRRGPDECWEWQGSRYPNGYGQFGAGGTHTGAHRASWELAHGPIPEGLFVLHHCDNPPCVNPAHLFLGTQTDNLRDAARKGRLTGGGPLGERHGRAKLTEAAVLEIRRRYREAGETQAELGSAFGVVQTNVGRIVRGETWVHVA